jgi:hypothetical protein
MKPLTRISILLDGFGMGLGLSTGAWAWTFQSGVVVIFVCGVLGFSEVFMSMIDY